MKNTLKISILAIGMMSIASLSNAQGIKTETTTTAGQLEAPKTDSKTDNQATTGSKQEPAKTTTTSKTDSKQEPVKNAPGGSTSKTEKKDSTSGGGTRMAITEQGMPKTSKNKKKSAAASKTTPPPAKETPKK